MSSIKPELLVLHHEETPSTPTPISTLSAGTSSQDVLMTNDSNCGQLGREYTDMSFEGQFDTYSIESPVEILHDVWDELCRRIMKFL